MKEKIIDYIRLFRIQGIGLIAIIPVLGALSTGVKTELSTLFYLFIIGILQHIYLFVSNDVIDIEIDRQCPQLKIRPLAKGTISKKTGIIISIFCFITVYILTFIFFYRNQDAFYLGLICLTIAALLGTINNIYGKKFAYSAFLAGAAQALIIPYAAYMISNKIHLNNITIIISLLTFNQILFMTAISGGIKDADHDYKKNVKNYATKTGVYINTNQILHIPKKFIAFGMIIRLTSTILIFTPMLLFHNLHYQKWQILLITLFTVITLIYTIKMFKIKHFNREKIRKNIITQILFRSTITPMMLFPVIGTKNTLIFLLFAFTCYIIPIEIIKILKKTRQYYN